MEEEWASEEVSEDVEVSEEAVAAVVQVAQQEVTDQDHRTRTEQLKSWSSVIKCLLHRWQQTDDWQTGSL